MSERGVNKRQHVGRNSGYKEARDDVGDLVMEEVEIVQDVVGILFALSGGIPLLNGSTIFSFDRSHGDSGVSTEQIMSHL